MGRVVRLWWFAGIVPAGASPESLSFLMIDADGRRFFVFFGRLGESAGLELGSLAGGAIGGDCHDEEMMSVV